MADEGKDIEKLYEYGERLNEAKDKSQVPNLSHFFIKFQSFSHIYHQVVIFIILKVLIFVRFFVFLGL